MRQELVFRHWAGIGFGSAILLSDLIFFFSFITPFGPKIWYFNPLFVVGSFIIALPFILDFFAEQKRQKEMEEKFLEFVRSLVESVKSGVSIPRAVQHTSASNYGSLTPYVKKLATQIEWGYPLHEALTVFVTETNNPVIRRSIAIVMQAERSGGDMGSVLESVTNSVLETKRIKEERKAQAYNQIIQGYIIYFIFIIIMLVLQVYLIPKLGEIGGEVMVGLSGAGVGESVSGAAGGGMDLGAIFLVTIIIQGLFAGLMIGKFAEGNFKVGLKHSIVMVLSGYLLMNMTVGILGTVTMLVLLIPVRWLSYE